MPAQDLGPVLTGPYPIPGGTARLYERGVVIDGAAGEVVVELRFPMIGRPHISTGGGAALDAGAIRFRREHYELSALIPLVQAALAGRVGLVPTGEHATPTPLTVGPAEVVEPERPSGVGGAVIPAVYGVPLTGPLRERQLYDVALARDGGQWLTVAPHAVYHKSAWSDFGLAHVTDLHVARRIDAFRPTLRNLGLRRAAALLLNWNDRFRGFVRYANYLHGIGALDVVVATGDLCDYQFELDDDLDGLGNAGFLRQLILGQAPGPDFPDVEELRVPIFMTPGNHDYRKYPYYLIFDLAVLGIGIKRIDNFQNYRLRSSDAIALWQGLHGGEGVPSLDTDSAARMVEIDPDARPFRACLADGGSYVVRLGAHRIVMVDSAHDVGVLDSIPDLIRALVYITLTENERTFADASPNSEGVEDSELTLVRGAFAESPGGLLIVGVHAPLFNLWNDEYPYFLRETQRQQQRGQDYGYLARHGHLIIPPPPPPVEETIERLWPLWFSGDHDHRHPSFVKRGGTHDLLDYAASRGHSEELVRLLAGIGSPRPADVVLAGHTHRHNEFTVRQMPTGDLAYFMDFYTSNPARYYPTPFVTGYRPVVRTVPGPGPVPQTETHLEPTSEVTYVEVDAEAIGNSTPWPMPTAAKHGRQIQVPPYPTPLSEAADPRAWWAAHRPLALQTAPLGPQDNSQVGFSGFRLLSVKANVIDKVHFVSTGRLEAHGYRLPLEEAVRPDPPRRLRHSERSRRHRAPEAQGAPAAIWLPALGVHDAVYRDAQGRIHELWKDVAGGSGTSNVTELGGGPPAAGDPSVYFDAASGNLVVLYRAGDGNIHSLYWSTGAVGHDALTGSVGAPKAVGNPRGYYEAATGVHHVIYRSGDGHLNELWWSGPDPVSHGDLTQQSSTPEAASDPSPYVDTRRGDNIVVYRGRDGHVHSLYWRGRGQVGHDDLSGFAQAPNAAGDPVAYYLHDADLHQVTYRGADGHIYELYWPNVAPVTHWDLSTIAGAPPAASDPAVYYSAGTNTKHVIYRSADGQLHEIWWFPGGTPAHTPTTVAALAPPAVDRPAAFTIDGPNSQHVIYRGTDNQIHEIRWV
jgi:calcineurin-like phosphoesterase family protein